MFRSGMGVLTVVALLLTANAWGGPHIKPREPVGWTAPLQALGIDGRIDSLPNPRTWRVRQVSSYDRTGGNNDDRFGEYVYEGGIVLADLKGPGSVLRIWTRNPRGTLMIYVDDLEHPIIITEFADLFNGGLELSSPGFNLFSPPFTGEEGGGYYSYVPIPYKESCRLVVTGEDDLLSYHVSYATFSGGTPLQSFDLTLSRDDINFFKRWRDEWNKPVGMRFHDRKTEKTHDSMGLFWPKNDTLLYSIVGPGVIVEIELDVESADPDILDKTWIKVYFDGQKEPGILSPLGDFFSVATPDASDFVAATSGKVGTRMYCRYPMPFKQFAEFRLVTTSDQIADVHYFFTWKSGPIDDLRYFFARYNSANTVAGESYKVAEIYGTGHFVGSNISASGADSLSFLEGDDTFIVDDEPASNFHGTGTDDYFNAGWYFSTGVFATPTHGVTSKVAKKPAAFAAYRTHITDPVPFKESFKFYLEHGPKNDRPGLRYTSVSYWYQEEKDPQLWTVHEYEDPTVDDS